MQLFRPEALRGQDRLHGEVMLVRPVSWTLLGVFFAIAAIAAAAFLLTAEHRISTPVAGTLVREGARLKAVFEVPSAAAGAVAPGQTVRLIAVDYPHESYGSVEARVEQVSAAAISGAPSLVHATLVDDSLRASGRLQPLAPGLAVIARIETGSRSLASWLLGRASATEGR